MTKLNEQKTTYTPRKSAQRALRAFRKYATDHNCTPSELSKQSGITEGSVWLWLSYDDVGHNLQHRSEEAINAFLHKKKSESGAQMELSLPKPAPPVDTYELTRKLRELTAQKAEEKVDVWRGYPPAQHTEVETAELTRKLREAEFVIAGYRSGALK